MKAAFQKITGAVIGISVCAIILGLILIFYPSMSLKTLGVIGGIYLLAHGTVLLYLSFKLSKVFVPYETMFNGAFSILLGIVLLCKPDSVSVLIAIAFGMWIISSSVNNIKVAYFFREIEQFPSVLMILIGVLDIILGCLVIINPFETSISLTVFIGIILCIHSIFNIINMIILRKNVTEKEKLLKNMIQERLTKIMK